MTLEDFYEAFRRVAWDFASDRQGRLRDGQWRCPIEAVGEIVLGERLGYRLAAARLRLPYDVMTDIITAADGNPTQAPSVEVRRTLLRIVQEAQAERDLIAEVRALVERPDGRPADVPETRSRLGRARRRVASVVSAFLALI
ncbi:MAG TPA: hypothetical protein VFD84_13650 [Candidatus Binatia bacterium]|jgi:hypothetical protein|nr:hypothetical protein [Candidatus Binatia bacterium]